MKIKRSALIFLTLITTVGCGVKPKAKKGGTLNSADQIEFAKHEGEQSSHEGIVLYNKHCQSCHGEYKNTTKWGATVDTISDAIDNIVEMQSLSNLSNEDIFKIAQALNDFSQRNAAGFHTCEDPTLKAQISPIVVPRITLVEIRNTLAQVYGANLFNDANVSTALAAFPMEDEHSTAKTARTDLQYLDFEAMFDLSLALANSDIVKDLSFATCADSDDNCIESFLSNVAPRLLGTPLTQQQYNSILSGVNSEVDKKMAVLVRLFNHPQFTSRVYRGQSSCEKDSRYNLVNPFYGPNKKKVPARVSDAKFVVFEINSPASSYDEFTLIFDDATAGAKVVININDRFVALHELKANQNTLTLPLPEETFRRVGVKLQNPDGSRYFSIASAILEKRIDESKCQIVQKNGLTPLSKYELADKMASLIFESRATEEMWGHLKSSDEISKSQMIEWKNKYFDTPQGQERVRRIFHSWFETDRKEDPSQIIADLHGITASGSADEAREELDDYLNYFLFNKKSAFKEFLSSDLAFPRSSRMAKLLGLEKHNNGSAETLGEKRGIFMRPINLFNEGTDTSPILRGVFFRINLLCDEMPVPNLDNIDALREDGAEKIDPLVMSGREVTTATTSTPECAVCHARINPPGFIMESYDPMGVRRISQSVFSNSGEVLAEHPIEIAVEDVNIEKGLTGRVESVEKFVEMVSESNKLKVCFAKHLVKYAEKRQPTRKHSCQMSQIENDIVDGKSVIEIIKDGLVPDAFMYKLAI